MSTNQQVLKVYETGPLTVVGFGGEEVPDYISVTEIRDETLSIIKQHDCKVLAFDLTGVKLIPSGLLGLLASLRHSGVEVHLYNPSEDIRDVLEVTKLDRVMPVHEIEL